VNQLSQKMQSKIVDEIEITPEEVKQFFNNIPRYDLPIFGAELEISQIVVKPEVSEAEKKKVIDRLESIRDDVVINGSSFATKAILYSQDPGSRSTGGKYTLNRNRPQMVKEFRDVAYRLKENEVSEPFETEFGWHIVKVDRIRGQEVDVRHILLTPEISPDAMAEAKKKVDLIRKRVVDGELTFQEAAKSFSDEKSTKNNGGVLINPTTGDTRFELTKIDPVLYNQIQRLGDNEISSPLLEKDRQGNQSYKLIMVSDRFDEHVADYSKDYIKIKELALKEKQLTAIQKWMNEKIIDTYISVNDQNKQCNFANKWLKN
jgi:peptidyl-prolyl cis-trans isomerase SurA